MVHRIEVTYDEIVDIMDVKYIAAATIGHTLQAGIYEITDINLMLKSLLPDGIKVIIANDDNRLKSNLTTNKTKCFSEKIFFLHRIRFY